MLHSDKPKFIFVHIAKAGGSSITKTIANHLNIDRDWFRSGSLKFIKIGDLLKKRVGPPNINLDDYFIFTCVRNPFARIVSYFFYRQQIRKPPNNLPLDLTFEKWVKNGMFKELTRQTDQLSTDGRFIHPRINFMAKLENIDNDWPFISQRLFNEQIPLLHDKQSQHRPYQELYTPETKTIVDNYYRSDLEILGYTWEN